MYYFLVLPTKKYLDSFTLIVAIYSAARTHSVFRRGLVRRHCKNEQPEFEEISHLYLE